MISFGNRVFAGVNKVRIERRSYWIRVGPKSNESVCISDRKGHRGTEKATEDRDGDWNDASTSQGC